MQQPTYDEQITMKNEMKLRELCAGLPAFEIKHFFHVPASRPTHEKS